MCCLPLVGWLASGNWFIISLITSPLMALVFIGWNHVPESPRWLLSQPGRTKEAVEIVKQMAKVNDKPTPEDLEERLQNIADTIQKEKTWGYISLFTTRGLAIKTVLLTIALTSSIFTYYVIILNISNMGGSFYLNMLVLSAVELPATYLGTLAAVSQCEIIIGTIAFTPPAI